MRFDWIELPNGCDASVISSDLADDLKGLGRTRVISGNWVASDQRKYELLHSSKTGRLYAVITA